MLLWFQNKVEVLEYHADRMVKTATEAFRVPSVIRLRGYVKPYFAVGIRYSRQNVFLRDNFTCQYCRLQLPERHLTIDHVIPVSRGGKDEWTNVVASCSKCNNSKADRIPDEARMKLLKMPVRPRWLPMSQLRLNLHLMPRSWEQYLSG